MTKEQERFLDKLVEEHGSAMLQAAQRLTGDPRLAEDMVQDALLTACRKIDELYRHENPAGWLFKTLAYLIKREKSKARYTSEVPLEEWMHRECASGDSVRDCLPAGLTGQERDLLVWRVEDGLEYEEIAARLGISRDACRQRFSRAVRKCQKLMK